MRLAVIPARGGSKRIPGKNTKLFNGMPIIYWPIQAALNSNCFDKVIVSTDDEEIAKISRECGAETPFLRPKELADDFTGTAPVIKHAIDWLAKSGLVYDYVCCIYATAATVTDEDISIGLESLLEKSSDYSMAVKSYPHPIQRALVINDDGMLELLNNGFASSRTQDLKETYYDAGQFYWGHTRAWLDNKPILGVNTTPLVFSSYLIQDIDNYNDWELAEAIFQIRRKKK